MTLMKLDETDLALLEQLQKDSNLSIKQISKILKKPITTVHHRIKKLEREGIIKQYTLKLDHDKLGKSVLSYILITVNYLHDRKISQRGICDKISRNKEVEEISIITGEKDIILKVRVSSISQLNNFITHYLRNIEGIDKTQTMVVLEEIQ